MIARLVAYALSVRPLVLLLLAAFLAVGVVAFQRLDIEAYPDPSPPIIEIIAQPSGQSAEEVERLDTIPIEVQMSGIPGLHASRSISLAGLSDITLQFTYGTPYQTALQEVINRLGLLPPLPNGVTASISPESAVGEIYRYQLVGPRGFGLSRLKSLQDWDLTRRFKTVPGVLDVVGWGGTTKEYHVDVDLPKLAAYHLPLTTVLTALSNSNLNVSGRTLEMGSQEVDVIGVGLIRSLQDIEDIAVSAAAGTPVFIKDVAQVSIGAAPRLGIAGRDQDDDIVQGVVLMRQHEKTHDVISRVQQEVQRLNQDGTLPRGVRLVPIYDRSSLIDLTTRTVVHNLLAGIAFVFLIQWLFLGDLRSAVVVSATIPFALCFAVIGILVSGNSANLLSVGSVDFGIIVDATVVLVENVFRHLRSLAAAPGESPLATRTRGILEAVNQLSRSIFFSVAIIVAAFLPLFTMNGVEGRIFGPMAVTYGFALAGALIATFLIAPVLASYLLPRSFTAHEPLIVRLILPVYLTALRAALRQRALTLSLAALLVIGAAIALPRLGSEFLPKLEEGNLWIRVEMPSTINLTASEPIIRRIRGMIASHRQEVVTVVSQHGRPDDGTDTTGSFNGEFFAPLTPQDRWPRGYTKAQLIADLSREVQAAYPGMVLNFSQYIEDNVEEALSGVKGENSIKIFGPDLRVLERSAAQAAALIQDVPGVRDVGVFHELGRPTLRITVDRLRCARFALAPSDVTTVIQAAIGGSTVSTVFEGERTYGLVVRAAAAYRQDLQAIRMIPVATSDGGMIPLSALCTIEMADGASFVYREDHQRYLPIKFSVAGRDLGTTIREMQERLARDLVLPESYHLTWSGEYGELVEAVDRLEVIVPISFLLILLLLYSTFSSVRDSAIVLVGIPLTAVGGVLALGVTGTAFSVSAAVGFISLLGVAVMAGTIILTSYHRLTGQGLPCDRALLEVGRMRLRPVLMMCLSACIGLLPAAVSTAIGSETQRPLAMVIVGGMLLAPVLILLVVPVLISLAYGGQGGTPPSPATGMTPQPDLVAPPTPRDSASNHA